MVIIGIVTIISLVVAAVNKPRVNTRANTVETNRHFVLSRLIAVSTAPSYYYYLLLLSLRRHPFITF